MTTQMIEEAETPWDGGKKARPDLMIQAPENEKMKDRGGGMFDESQQNNNNSRKKAEADDNTEIGDMLMPWEEEAVQGGANAPPRNQRMARGGGEQKEGD